MGENKCQKVSKKKVTMKVCSYELAKEPCLKLNKGNIKIIPIKITEEERRYRRKEILKALIREDNV